jgi:hypothetical protein
VISLLLLLQTDGLELFEKRIRPVLATECYACHSAAKKKGGLLLDSPEGWLKGGRSGPAVKPGDPASLLLRSLRHESEDLAMPKDGAKLDPDTLRAFETWIRLGAPAPAAAGPGADVSWSDVLRQRKTWWSFQPLRAPPVPPGDGAPIDRFLKSPPADAVDPRALLRRLHFVLVGLPPTAEDVDAFVADPDLEKAADRLLASPRFGERWARHWMDWLRYAETHGSEGDPAIPFAWRWRDYLIRALNADVPYLQLVREQLAGDLLEQPRVEGDVVESALGPAHFRMVLHGFTPTDAHDEQATFVDNQIDTVTKAFLGLTVSCARCHDHKFDAISQADFTSLYGIFSSARPATVDVMSPARRDRDLARAAELKGRLRASLAALWLERAVAMPPLDWPKLKAEAADRARRLRDFLAQPGAVRLDLRSWFRDGPGGLRPAGEFALPAAGDVAVADLFPAGVVSHAYTDLHRGVAESPPFDVSGGTIWLRARGEHGRARYVVRHYPRSGLIYPKADLKGGQDQWLRWNVDYWKGERVHLEVGTSLDAPVETTGQERSWFVLQDALYAPAGSLAPPAPAVTLADLVDELPADGGLRVLRDCIAAWRDGALSDAQADYLGGFVRKGLLPVRLADLDPASAAFVREYRAIRFPAPIRAPGLHEGFAADAPLFVRGDPRKPAAPVARRFLEAFDVRPYDPGPARSGRRELAESFAASPLAARVLVNRAWHHVFGRGLVPTPDNFGRLGEPPSHPELLDHLASEFLADGASIKRLLRRLVTTRAFRAAPMRRLDAESIRDAMLALTGKLDGALGGPPAPGDSFRRSVYVRVVRNSLDPLLSAFDFPVPAAPRGARDVTNVPAQALALLNGASVRRWAADWAKRTDGLAPEARVRRLFLDAFARPATEGEVAASLEFLGPAPDWASLAHALFNAKEFIHVR